MPLAWSPERILLALKWRDQFSTRHLFDSLKNQLAEPGDPRPHTQWDWTMVHNLKGNVALKAIVNRGRCHMNHKPESGEPTPSFDTRGQFAVRRQADPFQGSGNDKLPWFQDHTAIGFDRELFHVWR